MELFDPCAILNRLLLLGVDEGWVFTSVVGFVIPSKRLLPPLGEVACSLIFGDGVAFASAVGFEILSNKLAPAPGVDTSLLEPHEGCTLGWVVGVGILPKKLKPAPGAVVFFVGLA